MKLDKLFNAEIAKLRLFLCLSLPFASTCGSRSWLHADGWVASSLL